MHENDLLMLVKQLTRPQVTTAGHAVFYFVLFSCLLFVLFCFVLFCIFCLFLVVVVVVVVVVVACSISQAQAGVFLIVFLPM